MWLVWPGKTFERGNMSCNAINMKEPTMQGSGKWIPEGFWAMGKVERRTNLIGLPWAAKKRVSGFEGWGLIPFLVLVSFHWVMLFFLLLVCYWHLWIILKLNSPFLLKWLWREFLGRLFFFSPRRIRITSYPHISRATAHNRISRKGQKCSEQGERIFSCCSASRNQEKEGAQASLSMRSFHEELGLEGGKVDTFYFLFFICGCRIQARFPIEEHHCWQSKEKMATSQKLHVAYNLGKFQTLRPPKLII